MPESLVGLIVQFASNLVVLVGEFLGVLFPLLLPWLPGGLWCAFWLWAVRWTNVWPVLARGAWLPTVLLVFLAALVWSHVSPSECGCLGFVILPNFWWQLGSVSALAVVALVCGWIQGQLHWAPADLGYAPALAHGHDGHGHAGHEGHAPPADHHAHAQHGHH